MLDSLRAVYIDSIALRPALEKRWQQQAKATGDNELLAFVAIMSFYGHEDKNPAEVDAFLDKINKAYKELPNLQAMGYVVCAQKYFEAHRNYEQAFAVFLEVEKLMELHGPGAITGYAEYYSEIAKAYYKFRNYKKSIELMKKGQPYTNRKWDFYNNIGVCFIELNNPDSAIYYLQKALDATVEQKMPDINRTITLGNIGYCHYLQKKFQQARPLIQIDLDGALRVGDKGLALGAAIPLADIYLTEKKWGRANALLILARKYLAETNYLLKYEKYFLVKSKYEQLTGNPQLALVYLDSAMRDVKRSDSIFNSLLVMRAQQRADMKTLTEEKQKLDNYKQLSRIRMWALVAIFASAFTAFLVVRYYRNLREKEKKHVEELKRTMELRQRLSADMHDDIGSTLSSISLYTQSLLMLPQPDVQKNILEKIKATTQNVQENISDIIWSVNPSLDAMDQVLARMRAFGADMAENADVQFTFNAAAAIAHLHSEMDMRKNIYLIYKEAVNNAVKYSQCRQIAISFKIDQDSLCMTIEDDGTGFDPKAKQAGNGLVNMQRRADEINARLNILSHPDTGTSIVLTLPVIG
ncbi:tetratricopeptide repeat-containing sensor histidine kinase [Taibaiella chishuiensis]|uniref:histidine kinase n=1 Tax=Taibaiella chishuiensis TaxID=1434707 RepID=A0A2P8D2Z6_9BACT|nr:ATP-binding protein [Taibaiella chishuiensis]PSK91594.1 signal transduction histidine kinase [Taibaiella chishuiensis]